MNNRLIVIFVTIALFMASSVFAEEAMNPEQDFEAFYADMAFLGPHWDLVASHWIDGCRATIELSDSFEPTDAGCQAFGELVKWILEQNPEICLVYVLPDESGWVPSRYNPIDYDWALCLADEEMCPLTNEVKFPVYDDVEPAPVQIENKSGSGSSGGCFIQTIIP